MLSQPVLRVFGFRVRVSAHRAPHVSVPAMLSKSHCLGV